MGMETARLEGHRDSVYQIAFSATGRRLSSVSTNGLSSSQPALLTSRSTAPRRCSTVATAVPTLVAALKDPQIFVRVAAAEALEQIDPKALRAAGVK